MDKRCVYPTERDICIKCKECLEDALYNGFFDYEDPWNDPDWID